MLKTLAAFPFLRDAGLPVDNPDARWMLFGWGSRAYYMATPELSDTSFGPLFKALTLDASVMHVEILGALDETHPAVSSFDVPEAGFERMLAFIRASFAEANGAPVHIEGAHYGKNDGFFEANGSFNALVGCNTWTARALREAGLQTGWWNPLPRNAGLFAGAAQLRAAHTGWCRGQFTLFRREAAAVASSSKRKKVNCPPAPS